MKTCELCGVEAMHHTTRPVAYNHNGQTITVDQPGDYCDSCGESVLGPDDLKATRKELGLIPSKSNAKSPEVYS